MTTPLRGLLVAGAAAAVLLASGAPAQAAPAIPKFKAPTTFGTSFQPDPKHDFTKGIHSRRNGILRGQIVAVRGGVAEYVPVKWKKSKHTEGYFAGPPEGDAMAYASRIAKDVVYLSALGCKASQAELTVSRNSSLGVKRCSRATLIKRHGKTPRPSLITVYKGQIVKVQEIFTP
ncbi:hypothetical protein AB0K18_07255 [Nonomuraea sp. NPDC049421]|uniref:hypothetical protein n=1 Tax=Nonomuraea sp. NPDC049421 TaxID=3155275 RepID=UPI003430BFE4